MLPCPEMRQGGAEESVRAAVFGVAVYMALMIGAPSLLAAEPASPLAQGMLGEPIRDQAAGAERFATADGALRFTLDRIGGGAALMRFEGSSEVLALKGAPGPYGDEYLKDDTGRVVLRLTAPGGITVYTRAHGSGAAVLQEGRAAPFASPAPPPGGLIAKFAEIERQASGSLGRPVSFEPPPASSLTSTESVGLAADAAARTAEGVAVAKPRHLAHVAIQVGSRPSARFAQQTLRVTIAPQLGYAGRPSADAIEAVLRAAKR